MKVRFYFSLVSVLFILFLSLGRAQAATITVTERADSFGMNNCSLRDAVEFINTLGTALSTGCVPTGSAPGTDDTIILEGGAPYVIDLPATGALNMDGDIDIVENVVIQGQGMDVTTVTADFPSDNADRVFDICPFSDPCIEAKNIEMIGLTISNGGSLTDRPDGAGILISDNGTLTLQDVHVRDNFGRNGGGIFVQSVATLLMEQSKVTGNQASDSGGGIINGSGGFLSINESTIDNNEAGFSGGGIENAGFGMFIYNSTVSRNRALGIATGGSSGRGGGISVMFPLDSLSIITNSTISTNAVTNMGGGIFVCATCGDGGSAGEIGAAGFNFAPGVYLFNDTITKNTVSSPNGAGGGIFFNPPQPPPTIIFGGVGATGLPGEFSVGLFNTILAQNTAITGPDCFSTVESGHFNLFGVIDDDCVVDFMDATDIVDPNPGLGLLLNNGGPTETHGLFSDSPAIDNANNMEGCQAPGLQEILVNDFTLLTLTRDQRNFLRPIAVNDPNNPICDIGAFEFQVFDFTVTKDDGLNGEAIDVGTDFNYTITVTNNGPGTATAVTLNDPVPSGMAVDSVTPSQGTCSGGAVISCDLGALAVGETATIIVTVTATETGDFTNIVTITLNNEFQQQLTKTAQVTTVVTEGIIEGSGIHCGLQRGAIHSSPRFAVALVLMSLTLLGVYTVLRRRTQG